MGYLVISRRINERITIGPNIEILISDIRQDSNGEFRVDLAMLAPKEFDIKRKQTHAEEEHFGLANRNQSRQRHKRN